MSPPKVEIRIGPPKGKLSGSLDEAPEEEETGGDLEEAVEALSEALASGDTAEAAAAFRAAVELCSLT